MIKTAFLAFIEQRINGLLELDPVTLKRLYDLDGSVINVRCTQPDFECFVFFDALGLRFAGYHEGEVTASFTGSLRAFSELAINRSTDWQDIPCLEVSGDSDFLAQLLVAHQEMELDWESVFCEYLGVIPGHTVAESIRQLASQIKPTASRVSNAMGLQLSEYLQEELKVLPTHAEINSFCREVDRLKKALALLEEKIKPAGGSQ